MTPTVLFSSLTCVTPQHLNNALHCVGQLKAWMDRTKSDARKHGFVGTLLGHRRYLPDLHAQDHAKRAYAERQAVNSVVQGSAADVIKLAMVRMQGRLNALTPEARRGEYGEPRLLMQIHDELIYEVRSLPLLSLSTPPSQPTFSPLCGSFSGGRGGAPAACLRGVAAADHGDGRGGGGALRRAAAGQRGGGRVVGHHGQVRVTSDE